jgi:hypothetical protein
MADDVLDALMGVFNSANYRFLTLAEITQQLQHRGFYQNAEFHKAEANIWDLLCSHQTAKYRFLDIERSGETIWGLEWWLPPRQKRRTEDRVHAIEPLHVGLEIQHTLSPNKSEIENGRFPLRGQNLNRLVASMDEQQRKHSVMELSCYGSEKFMCAITHDGHDNWFLEGRALQRWYEENGLQPGDKIWVVVEGINPLVLRIYAEWDRDADTFRRYEQSRNLEALPVTDLAIRDLIWIYFKRSQKIAHRSEIAAAILVDRPEISERSVDACLGANPHLFARISEGNWGLKEWGVEQVTMTIRPKGSDPGTTLDDDLPTATVPLDYILVNIAAEDLVYKILRGSKTSLTDAQITERIAKYLGVDRGIVARTTFLNLSDSRIVHFHDGTFSLRKNLEEVIDDLAARERKLKKSLDLSNEEANKLKEELALTVSQYEARIRSLESERAEARYWAREWLRRHTRLAEDRTRERTQLTGLLSKFLATMVSYVDRPNVQITSESPSSKPGSHDSEEDVK